MPVAFCVTLALALPESHSRFAIAASLPAAAGASAIDNLQSPFSSSIFVRAQESMRWFVPFWFAGVALFYLRSLGSWVSAQKLRRTGAIAAPAFWQDRLKELATRLHIPRSVGLLESCLIDVPVVLGFLRPVILLPAGLLTGLPAEQVEYLLLHELAHIRRLDYAVNLLQKAVKGLLFYHPAVWWVSNVLRTERENCCDDTVLDGRADRGTYASTLADLECNRWSIAQASSGGNLSKRIRRILGKNENPRVPGTPFFSAALVIVTFAIAFATLQKPVQAQQSAQTAAESPWQKWVDEDVAYIITDAERQAYKNLTSDPEREHFIEQFWDRRNPIPGSADNQMKIEHYRRIAYANQHFSATIPGWKTDRGRIYITFGPPDEIDSHPSCSAAAPAYADWRYRMIQGIGNQVNIEFKDSGCTGDYVMTSDPAAASQRFTK